MVVIRLARGGANKRPFYRLVVADRRCRRDGRNIEQIGFFNPIAAEHDTKLSIKMDRLDYWISVGAQMSDRVEELVKAHRKAGTSQPVASTESEPVAKKAKAKKGGKAEEATEA